MRVCIEEVSAADDVLAELRRLDDRDRLDARLSFERDCVAVGREPGVDVAERGAKRRDLLVSDGDLNRRVVAVKLVPADERLHCCGHR